MKVTLVDRMGTDLTVVNAARCSFGKRKTCDKFVEVSYGFDNELVAKVPILDSQDVKLINYLAKHNHWSPMAHPSVQFHIKAPIFVARQLAKHQVGLVWNEISRRYVDAQPEYYMPSEWRLKAKNIKQGSSEVCLDDDEGEIHESVMNCAKECSNVYYKLLDGGVAPEMARMVLPQNMFTEWYWSGTLYAFARICKLRLYPDAQQETRIIAQMIYDKCEKLFPVTWKAIFDEETFAMDVINTARIVTWDKKGNEGNWEEENKNCA